MKDRNYIQALGFEAMSPENEAWLRRHGIYTQRPASDGFFMVRIRIPGGDLTPLQLRAIADLSSEHGRGLADVTVRQSIQLHWVRIESLLEIFDRLREVGLSTTEAGGDGIRNIINCPVSGVDHDELYDTTNLIKQATDSFAKDREFSNLPRKFKIAITGCALRCVYPEINDIGIFAVRDGERGVVAFRARVGGGLSITARFSKDLGVLIEPDEVIELCGAIASVFRDQANGENGKRSRLNYAVEHQEISRFRDEVEARLGRKLRRAADRDAPPVTERDRSHLGIHSQHQDALCYAGLSILGGRTSAGQLKQLADLAEQHGSGRIRTTSTQNIVLLDIPQPNLEALTRDLDWHGFDYRPSWSRKGVIACTGVQFCKLALTETKNRAAELTDYLESAVNLADPIRISVTGCPNSCGQHRICDVGLEGSLTTIDGVKRESFEVFLGGGVGAQEAISRRIGVRIPSDELRERLAQLFTYFKQHRHEGETFQEFCRRHSDEELIEALASAPSTPALFQIAGRAAALNQSC
ncbi:MAG TPA: nitrite/sulfite reductase [Blastocatellia bacterium]|nr:nitrite/sulfite reductase [Blastocatellia bacterium]